MAGENTALFLNQLMALRDTLRSGAAQIDGILELAQRPSDAPQHSGCPHPVRMRVPAPAMGHPGRFHCKQCKQDVEE